MMEEVLEVLLEMAASFKPFSISLLQMGEVTGSLRGGNAMWTPACGEQQQQIAGCAAAALWKS